MSIDLQGRVVVVTGASRGIGRCVARQAAEAGAKVAAIARDASLLASLRAEAGDDLLALPCELSDPTEVSRTFDAITERFGRVDALLNVAAANKIAWIEDATDEDIAAVMGTNLLGPIYTTRRAIPIMRAGGGGDIVNVSSEITLDDMPLMTLYSTSKAALESFTKSMNKELRPHRIRVGLCRVGHTHTHPDMTDDHEKDPVLREWWRIWDEDGYMKRVGGGNSMEPEVVAEVLLLMISRPRSQMLDVVNARAF